MSLAINENNLSGPELKLPAIKNNNLSVSELKLPTPSQCLGDLGKISVKNCNNATFGTKIDGNIIVNQYFNDTAADKAQSDGLTFTDSVVLSDWTLKLLKYKYMWLSLILTAFLAAVLCILFIPTGHLQDETEDTATNLNFTEVLRTRQQWSKYNDETDCKLLIERPAKYVVIGHTVTLPCKSQVACETTVLQILHGHRTDRHRCDISYNFVIGDDGYIYEGRGWKKLGVSFLSFSCSSLGVGFVGNFNLDKPSDIMIHRLNLLLDEGVRLGQISPNYKIIAHSQLNNWASPGIHVEELMRKWDHWSVLTKEDFQCPNTSEV